MRFLPALASLMLLPTLAAWGIRGHTVANLAAVETTSSDGPAFLRAYKPYIGHMGTMPDTWRSHAEPFLRISEDANHSWYTEGFDFIPDPPRSRTEFTLRVYDEYLKFRTRNAARAKLLNIRYTGLQAYSIMEGYERMKAGMRLYRAADADSPMVRQYAAISPSLASRELVQQMLAQDIAFYMGWVGHYVADAAQPLHNSIHHDGWSGANPRGYTRDPEIHGRFESNYVDLIELSEGDVAPRVAKTSRHLGPDVWKAVLGHSLEAREFTEAVYRLDLRGGFTTRDDAEARDLAYSRLAAGAAFLRDLAYTAWMESTKPVPPVDAKEQMQNPANPRYNPAAGSAPAR